MIVIIDLERYACEILEYIQLHLGELYGERFDDGERYIDTDFYRPDQLLVYETILSIAMSSKVPAMALDDGVTNIYRAMYLKYPEVGTIRISMMLEEILSTDAYCGIVREIDKMKQRHQMDSGVPAAYRLHRKLTTLVIEILTGAKV